MAEGALVAGGALMAGGTLVVGGALVAGGELVAGEELVTGGALVARGIERANSVAKEAVNVIQGIYSKGEWVLFGVVCYLSVCHNIMAWIASLLSIILP